MSTTTFALRPAVAADRTFLRDVFASTRPRELAAIDDASARAAFVEHQFAAQDAHYRGYEDASFSVIEVDGAAAGRLYVARWPSEIRIMEIALLEPFRGRGIGTAVLRSLMEEADASGRSLSIHVEVDNPARSLYERLGFVPAGEQAFAIYVLLSRPAAS